MKWTDLAVYQEVRNSYVVINRKTLREEGRGYFGNGGGGYTEGQ
jgi:hypothetical protein